MEGPMSNETPTRKPSDHRPIMAVGTVVFNLLLWTALWWADTLNRALIPWWGLVLAGIAMSTTIQVAQGLYSTPRAR